MEGIQLDQPPVLRLKGGGWIQDKVSYWETRFRVYVPGFPLSHRILIEVLIAGSLGMSRLDRLSTSSVASNCYLDKKHGICPGVWRNIMLESVVSRPARRV